MTDRKKYGILETDGHLDDGGCEMDIQKYLNGNEYTGITTGKSGAVVYDVYNEYILKVFSRRDVDDERFESYKIEALFYRSKAGRGYLPEVFVTDIKENETVLLMKKYKCPAPDAAARITRAIAQVHADDIPDFLENDTSGQERLYEAAISQALDGWKDVLAEHRGAFDERPLHLAAERINDIIVMNAPEKRVLLHGDLHFDNLLEDDNGDIRICDWQCVRTGDPSEDLSFFLSRAEAEDITVDRDAFLQSYSRAVMEITGREADIGSIIRRMSAANVVTTFTSWHYFLHGSSEERVQEIYGKMEADLMALQIG